MPRLARFAFFVMAVLVAAFFLFSKKTPQTTPQIWRDGDVVFHRSRSSQSRAIALATGSEWTHCGIVFQEKGAWKVLEAVQPVRAVSLESWIKRGEKGLFAVKRLKNGSLSEAQLKKMKTEGRAFLGKNYDWAFGWSDDKIYCSELVWKIYKNGAGIELCPTQRLGDFDLESPEVRQKIRERWGEKLPLEEPVVPPSALFSSSILEAVD